MGEKPILRYPVAVEGKYDKIKLESLFEGQFILTGGFGVYNDRQKKDFFIKITQKTPLIVFTDSDHAGLMIRNYLKNILPSEKLIHLYIPQVKGKEKRKSAPSAEGFLGVEGSDNELLREIFKPYYADACEIKQSAGLSRLELYEKGYEGGEGSKEKRKALLKRAGLPDNLSTSAMLEALNLLYSREELDEML